MVLFIIILLRKGLTQKLMEIEALSNGRLSHIIFHGLSGVINLHVFITPENS